MTVGVSALVLLLPLLIYAIYLMHLYYGVVSGEVENNEDDNDKREVLANKTEMGEEDEDRTHS